MAPTVTVTGNMIDLGGNATSGYAEFNLVSPTSQQDLKVSPSGIIAPKLITSATGTSFSVLLYGNDVIVDTGGNSDTYYTVNLYTPDNHIFWTANYKFTGSGTVNLVSTTPLNPAPVVTVPTTTPLAVAAGGTGVSQANANIVFAGPTSGGAQPPAFRSLVNADLPTSISIPQNTSATPVQIGPNWYPGTASGVCTVPAAPTVATETISSPTGNFNSTTTYYVVVTGVNRNGQTTKSAETSYKPSSGSTNSALIQLSDYAYRSGCYAYRAYIGTVSGGPYFLASAYTLPVGNISSWTCNTAKLCTVTWTANPGFIPGQQVVLSGAAVGGSSTTINGTFTLVAQQGSTPTTSFFFRASATSDSSNTAQGTGTVVAGLGSDASLHMASGDLIVSTVPVSGTQPPSTNTATIDPIQVALNATCNYAANSCTQGQLIVPQGTSTLTTPLIVSNQQTVQGVNSPTASGKSQITCSWADPNLGCVMAMGTLNGVAIRNVSISNSGHGLEILGWGPGYAGSNDWFANNEIVTTDLTGVYAAIYWHSGVFYEMHFQQNSLNGGLACVLADSYSGSNWTFDRGRWNGADLHIAGYSTNGFLGYSSVTDPDRAANRGGFPNGASQFYFSNFVYESGTGVVFDLNNIGAVLFNLNTADSTAISGTPALIEYGSDTNSGSSTGNLSLINTALVAAAGVNTAIKVTGSSAGNTGPIFITNSLLGATNAVDLNSAGTSVYCANSECNPAAAATTRKIINATAGTNVINTFGNLTGGTAAGEYVMNQLTQGTRFAYKGNADGFTFYPTSAADWSWYGGNPATAASKFWRWTWNSGARQQWYQNDGATLFFELYSQTSNQINMLAPVNPANTQVNIGTHFRFDNATTGNYFQTAGSPTSARTITFPDNSGTVAELNLAQSFTATQTFNNPLVAAGTAAGLTGTGACGTITTQSGGSWAGTAKCTGSTAASTLTITPGTTAPHGWVCYVQDQTTPANLFQQTSNTTTTCVLTVASVTQNDVFVFTATAF